MRTATARLLAVVIALGIPMPAPAAADVVDRSASGFTLRATALVAAPPARAYRALVDIGAWWSSDHTYSGDARNMSIAAQPGGCFCEKLPDGGGVEHGRVLYLAPGSVLRLAAALGPLQALGVTGSLTWQIVADGPGSRVTVTYAVGGYAPGGLEALAGPVDAVLAEQVQRFTAHADAVK